MSVFRISICAAIAFCAAAPALAQDAAATPAPASAVKPAKEKKVCHREQAIGSNIPKVTCHTAEEWKQIQADSGLSAMDIRQMNGGR